MSQPKHAVYTGAGRPVCPICWSQLSWQGRVSRDGRGWSLAESEERIEYDGALHPVATVRYPCSNTACGAVVLTSWLGGHVGREAAAPFAERYRLSPSEQEQFDLGQHRNGVWVDAAGEPKPIPLPAVSRRTTTDEARTERAPRSPRTDHGVPTRKTKPAAAKRSRVSTRKSRA